MFNEKIKAKNLLKNGLYEGANPHTAFVILAKYYKHTNHDKEATKTLIMKWFSNQDCTIPFDEVVEDLNRVTDYVFSHNPKFISDISLPIYLEEIHRINNLKTHSNKIVAFSMLCMSKLFGDKDRVFKCSASLLGTLSDMNKRHIFRMLINLEEQGYIEYVERNKIQGKSKTMKFNDKGFVRKAVNKYRVEEIEQNKQIYTVKEFDNIVDDFHEIVKIAHEQHGMELSKNTKKRTYEERGNDRDN